MPRHLLTAATLTAILSVAACSSAGTTDDDATAPEATPTPTPAATAQEPAAEPTPTTFDVTGALVMDSPMAIGRSSDHEAGGMCMLLNQDLSFSDDQQLLLLDGTGAVAAIGTLGDFTFTEAEDTNTCMRRFAIDKVPEGDFFKLQFGDITSDVVDMNYLADQEVSWTFG